MTVDDKYDRIVWNVVIYYVLPAEEPPYNILPVFGQELDHAGLRSFRVLLREKGFKPHDIFLPEMMLTVPTRDSNYPIRIHAVEFHLGPRMELLLDVISKAHQLDPDDF